MLPVIHTMMQNAYHLEMAFLMAVEDNVTAYRVAHIACADIVAATTTGDSFRDAFKRPLNLSKVFLCLSLIHI